MFQKIYYAFLHLRMFFKCWKKWLNFFFLYVSFLILIFTSLFLKGTLSPLPPKVMIYRMLLTRKRPTVCGPSSQQDLGEVGEGVDLWPGPGCDVTAAWAGKGWWCRESIIGPGGSRGLEQQRISIKEVSVSGAGEGGGGCRTVQGGVGGGIRGFPLIVPAVIESERRGLSGWAASIVVPAPV